jgi:hypothetical protein
MCSTASSSSKSSCIGISASAEWTRGLEYDEEDAIGIAGEKADVEEEAMGVVQVRGRLEVPTGVGKEGVMCTIGSAQMMGESKREDIGGVREELECPGLLGQYVRWMRELRSHLSTSALSCPCSG